MSSFREEAQRLIIRWRTRSEAHRARIVAGAGSDTAQSYSNGVLRALENASDNLEELLKRYPTV